MITKNQQKIIFIFPIIISILLLLFIIIPFTRNFGFWLLEENKPIEILTFIFFIIGGVYGMFFSIKLFKIKANRLPAYFFLLFSAFLILIGMEEISWGQQFFHFETPDQWKAINKQGETTLHNLGFMQKFNDNLHFIFGMAAIIGVLIRNHPFFKEIGVPIILLPWFLIIVFQSAIDILVDTITVSDFLNFAIERANEFIELLIAISAFLYLLLSSEKRVFNNKAFG